MKEYKEEGRVRKDGMNTGRKSDSRKNKKMKLQREGKRRERKGKIKKERVCGKNEGMSREE